MSSSRVKKTITTRYIKQLV